jgi:acyl-coenzyme A thioesterase PaaI-like protein
VTPDSGGVVGRCTLGIAHEGPPGYGHGGMSAMLLDELMGWACAAAGMPGMTVSLQVCYHRPVPLGTPLRVYARVTGTEDRKIFVDGSIGTEDDPSVVVVTADGVFVSPDPDRTRALFPNVHCVLSTSHTTDRFSAGRGVRRARRVRLSVRPWPPGLAREPPGRSHRCGVPQVW